MQRKISTAALMGALALGFAGTASADEDARIAQLEAQVAQLQAQQQGDWLTEARADEVRGLVQDVLADADTRATLLQEGMMAGIDDNGKVFLQSADGQFSMNISGQIQFRYYFNFQDDRDTELTTGVSDEAASNLSVRRAKVRFTGTVADDWDYGVVLAASSSGNFFAEDVFIGHDLGDGWRMQVGLFKLPFARQELISSTRQVAVDRSLTTEFFTLNRSEQVQFSYGDDQWKFHVSLSDGANTGFTGLPNGGAVNDFAVTVRADVRLDGEWADAKSEFGSDNDALFLGGAAHYEVYDGIAAVDNSLAWTVDLLWKTGGFGITGAIFGNHVSSDAAGVADVDQFGGYAQVDYVLDEKWDIFARYNYIDDDIATDELHAVTVGLNYHVNANVKFTTDVIFTLAGDNPTAVGGINGGESSSGLGMQGTYSDDDEQFAWRAQLQLLF